MTATIKKLHQGLDNVDFIGTEAEGACLERALTKCLSDREAALKELADAARRVDKAAFGHQGDFGQAHQSLLKALERAGDFIRS